MDSGQAFAAVIGSFFSAKIQRAFQMFPVRSSERVGNGQGNIYYLRMMKMGCCADVRYASFRLKINEPPKLRAGTNQAVQEYYLDRSLLARRSGAAPRLRNVLNRY
jgi:hypothetical protein